MFDYDIIDIASLDGVDVQHQFNYARNNMHGLLCSCSVMRVSPESGCQQLLLTPSIWSQPSRKKENMKLHSTAAASDLLESKKKSPANVNNLDLPQKSYLYKLINVWNLYPAHQSCHIKLYVDATDINSPLQVPQKWQ